MEHSAAERHVGIVNVCFKETDADPSFQSFFRKSQYSPCTTMDAIIDLFYLLTFYYYYSYKDYSDTRTQNVAGALYTSRCHKQGIGQMSVIQQHS